MIPLNKMNFTTTAASFDGAVEKAFVELNKMIANKSIHRSGDHRGEIHLRCISQHEGMVCYTFDLLLTSATIPPTRS